jgi:hypothetical protein
MMFGRHFKWKSECAFRYIGAVDLRRLDLSDLSVQVATISHRSVGRQTIARNAVVAISTATASHLDWLWERRVTGLMWCSPGVRSSSPACMAKIVTAGLASANCSPAKACFRLTTRKHART